ncbi:MAG: hypothetical protein IJK03_05655 [Oscillospiraceae bacterium]|nr:hypothetical protein [Oscillospiraceae bacterium]MBQ6428243.1 hypothetical protein [Oscillospiraceae bacterium]
MITSLSNKTPSDGFSSDGYITDQDCFSSVRYRTMSASNNGCGFIAAYNVRHALGHTVYWDEVRAELDAMHSLRIPGPTLMRVMREYLDKYVPGWVETVGREDATAAAAKSRTGIFRYQEGYTPHFVSFVRQDDGSFRFFNVDDGLEDFTATMEQFGREHLIRGTVIALTVPCTSAESERNNSAEGAEPVDHIPVE